MNFHRKGNGNGKKKSLFGKDIIFGVRFNRKIFTFQIKIHVCWGFAGGRVLTWGRGTSGQLGHGEMVNCLHPKSVESLEGIFIKHASAGWNHSGFVSGLIHSASAMNLM